MSVQAGDVYSRLTVVEPGGNNNQHRTWKCRCECGKFYVAREDKLLAGRTKSCGCLRIEISVEQKNQSQQIRQQQELTSCLREARKILLTAERMFNRRAWKWMSKSSGVSLNALTGLPPEDIRHFEKTGTPRQLAVLLTTWTELVSEVLTTGPEDVEHTIVVDIGPGRPHQSDEKENQ